MQSKLIWRTTTVGERSITDIEGVGNTRMQAGSSVSTDQGAKVYRWVENKDAVALTFGQAAYHKLSDGVDMLKRVYQALTANLSVLAGIVVATDGIEETGTGKYAFGWVQIYGTNSSVSISGATTGGADIAAGMYLKGVNAASHLVQDTTAETSYKRYVRAMEAITTTTTPAATYKKGYINAL
jgi:hypothetical protein